MLGSKQQQQQFESSQNLQRELAQTQQQPDIYKTLGEGSTLFNLLTGKPMYTAPKTYAPKGDGDGGSLEDLARQVGLIPK